MPLFFCLSVCRSIFLFNNLSAKPIDLSILLYSFLQLSFLVLALNLFIQLKCGEEFNDYISIPGRHVLKPSQPQQIIQTCVLSLNNTQMCSIFANNTACVLNLNKQCRPVFLISANNTQMCSNLANNTTCVFNLNK